MITEFIIESIVMFAAGWLLSQMRYDNLLATKTKEVMQLNEALNKAMVTENVLRARLECGPPTSVSEVWSQGRSIFDFNADA